VNSHQVSLTRIDVCVRKGSHVLLYLPVLWLKCVTLVIYLTCVCILILPHPIATQRLTHILSLSFSASPFSSHCSLTYTHSPSLSLSLSLSHPLCVSTH